MKLSLVLIAVCTLVSVKSFSQQTYHITYKDFGRSENPVEATFGGMNIPLKKIDYKLVFNDTMAFSYMIADDVDKDFDDNTIGKTIKSHSAYFFKASQTKYFGFLLKSENNISLKKMPYQINGF